MRKLEKFLKSKAFIYAAATYFFLMWWTRLELIGCVVAAVFVCAVLIFSDNAQIFLPFICLVIFGISMTDIPTESFVSDGRFVSEGTPLFFPVTIFLFVAIVGCLLYNLIKNKTLKKVRPKNLLMFALAASAFLFAGLFSPSFHFGINLLLAFGYGLLSLIYIVVRFDGFTDRQGYVSHILVAAGVVMICQMLVYYLGQDDILYSLKYKLIVVGWGLSNTIAVILALAIPSCLYLFQRTKKVLYLSMAFIFCAGVVFTLSRGILYILAVLFPVALGVVFAKAEKKKQTALLLSLHIAASAILAVVLTTVFADVFAFRLTFDNANRLEIWRQFIDLFLRFPLFGGGLITRTAGNWNLNLPHSTLFTLLSGTGIFGTALFGGYVFYKYCVLLKHRNSFSFAVLLVSIVFVAYSFVDVSVYLIYQNFFLTALLGAVACDRENGEYGNFSNTKTKNLLQRKRVAKEKKQ